MKLKRAIQISARVAELKEAASLVKARPDVTLSRDPKKRVTRLLRLLIAERRRNASLIDSL